MRNFKLNWGRMIDRNYANLYREKVFYKIPKVNPQKPSWKKRVNYLIINFLLDFEFESDDYLLEEEE